MLIALGTKDVTWRTRGARNGRQNFAGKFGRIDERSRTRIVDHDRVTARSQQGIERDRHDPGFNRAPKEIEERGTVLHHHQHAVSALEPEADEAARTTID